MNAVSVHRDLGEGRVGRGGVAVVVRAEVVGIVSMVCRLNLLQVAPILTYRLSNHYLETYNFPMTGAYGS